MLLISCAAAAAAACGGSTAVETVVGPDSVRCQTALSGQPTTIAPDGGSATVSVSAGRDCTWSASTDASWMQLGTTSGQGDGTISVTVARNEVASPRSGAVVVNDQRLTISQEPRPCAFELRASNPRLSSAGGRSTITVDTLTGCGWTAASSAAWLRIMTASGSGGATVEVEALPNDGGFREAFVTIGGQRLSIVQEGADGPGATACTASLSPTTINAAAAGGTHTVTVTSPASCDWMATSSATWLTFASPASGRGAAALTLTVARNLGAARSATVSLGSQTATVNQAAAPVCTVTIDPSSQGFGAAGGEGRVRVTTQDGCDWTATGGASWIQIASNRGTGSGDARYTVSANTATTSRSATLSIGGQSHRVTQQAAAPACTYSLDPGSRAFGAAGGDGTVTVNTQAGCQWSASGGPGWVAVSGGQGTGPGQFTYSVQANAGTAGRSGSISVAGQSHAITQEGAPAPTCTYALQPGSRNFAAGGGSGQIDVSTQAGCNWSSSSSVGWVSVSGSGTGPGQVTYTVETNTATAGRSGSITIGGQTHAITQDAAAPTCTYAVQPSSRNIGASGGPGQFDVQTAAGCAWSVSGGAEWVAVGTSSGNGPGQVSYNVQQNSNTSSRSVTLSVNGQPHTIIQEAAAPVCTYSVQPASQNFASGGGSGRFSVVTQAGCAWSVSGGASWATPAVSSGAGPGDVTYTVQANTATSARQTTITVNGQSHSVTQDAAPPPPPQPCSFAIDSSSAQFSAVGGQGTVRVTTASTCTWSASSPVSWITLSSPGGTGPGEVRYTVAPNSDDDEREATITIAGQSHRVRQEGDDN